MSIGGHWLDPKSAEQYLEAMDALQARTSVAYERLVRQELKEIETKLNALAGSDEGFATKTQQQLQDIAGLVGRFKNQTGSALLELEGEMKQIREAMAKAIKEQSEMEVEKLKLEKSKLRIEKGKLQLEHWKVAIGLITVFITGLLFPVLLQLLGISP